MTAPELLQLLAIGVIAGAFGQGVRAIVGIKKASDEVAAEGSTLRSEGLDVSRLVFSLFIGGIAGGVGVFTITGFHPGAVASISAEMFFGIIGIGYAGTDFIEGFVRTQLPVRGAMASNLGTRSSLALAGVNRYESTAERIRQSCDRLLQISANAGDCSAFVKAVGKEFSVDLTGQANDIVGQLTAANGWTELGSDSVAGQRAAAPRRAGDWS